MVFANAEAEALTHRAAEVHNGRVAPPTASIAPWVGSVSDAAGRERVALGAGVGF